MLLLRGLDAEVALPPPVRMPKVRSRPHCTECARGLRNIPLAYVRVYQVKTRCIVGGYPLSLVEIYIEPLRPISPIPICCCCTGRLVLSYLACATGFLGALVYGAAEGGFSSQETRACCF